MQQEIGRICLSLHGNKHTHMEKSKKLNRLRIVLAEKELTNKWLGQQIGKSEYTISRWTTNKQQPSLEQLFEIARILNVEINQLLETSLITKDNGN